MAQSIAPQVEIGSLTLKGLSVFSPILAALTADNVAPMTMIQLESLGTLFHINGPYAAKMPDLLRRCSSVHVDQIALSVGWRKGDAASVMAQSSGGQAIALMCFCLANICKSDTVGEVLYDLSEVVLARSLSVHSSVKQLEEAASVLAAKLQVIGFGNILAQQVVKFHDTYKQLGLTLPRGFFDFMTHQSTVDLFRSLVTVFEQEDTILRISGIHTMGHIVAVLLIMFPDNVMLIVEGLLIREGPRVSIILEIVSQGRSLPTTLQVEKKIIGLHDNPLPIECAPATNKLNYTFTWSGHIADALEIAFGNARLTASADLRASSCELLLSSLPVIKFSMGTDKSSCDGVASMSFSDLLGPEHQVRVSQICTDVFRVASRDAPTDLSQAYVNLVDAFVRSTGTGVVCTCPVLQSRDLSRGWHDKHRLNRTAESRSCLLCKLWCIVGCSIERGYYCLLVDAQPNSTCAFTLHSPLPVYAVLNAVGLQQISAIVNGKERSTEIRSWATFNYYVMQLIGNAMSGALALSNGACTLLPCPLLELKIGLVHSCRYKLLEGQLVLNGRSHRRLDAIRVSPRLASSRSLFAYSESIQPSSYGEHTQLSFTIRELSSCLELRTTILVRGQSVHLDLANIIEASRAIMIDSACPHNTTDVLDNALKDDVVTTSVANIGAREKNKIAIVQTMGNPVAQLLACDEYILSVLQRYGCLSCAVTYAKSIGAQQVIVGI